MVEQLLKKTVEEIQSENNKLVKEQTKNIYKDVKKK